LSVTCDRSVDFSGYSNIRHKSNNWNIFESGVKHLTFNGQMMDQKFVYVVHNIKHIWVIMWHFFTSTTIILFPTQLWELLCTYHVIKQCTEKETTSLSILLLTIKLNHLHDFNIMLQCLLHLNIYMWYGWILISCLNWKLQLFMCFWIIK
jgi:hypothetical protein